MSLTTTYVASPLSAPTPLEATRNVTYAKLAMLATLVLYGESPYVPHLLLTQVLRDERPNERHLGMSAGEAYLLCSDQIALYLDLGLSRGMAAEVALAERIGITVVKRRLFDLERPPTFEEMLAKMDELQARLA